MFPLKREIMAGEVLARLGYLLVEVGEQRSQGCEILAEPFHNRLRSIMIDLEFVRLEGIEDLIGKARSISYDAGQLFGSSSYSKKREVVRDVIRRYYGMLVYYPLTYGNNILELDSNLELDLIVYRMKKLVCYESYDEALSTIASGGQVVGIAEDEDCFIGLDEQVDLLLPYLVNEGGAGGAYRFVSLWGMGGLGKTAFAKAIYNHPDVRGHFCHFSWASAPNCKSDGDILNGILDDLLSGWQNYAEHRYYMSKKKSAEKDKGKDVQLFLRPFADLLQNEKCLIVLDDIMSPGVLGVLHKALSWGKRTSSRIVLTTRNLNISPSHQSPQCLIYVPRFLNDDQSWELLQKTAIRKQGSPGSAYAIPVVRPPFVCACFVLAQRRSIWKKIQATNFSLSLSL